MLPPPPSAGKLSGEVSEGDIALNYAKLQDRLDTEPTTTVCTPLLGKIGQCMGFRYPPVPAADSANVFGPVKALTYSSATGAVMIGSQRFAIDPHAKVGLKDATRSSSPEADLAIPIRVTSESLKVSKGFSARAALSINNEPLTTRISKRQNLINTIAAVLMVFSMVGWLGYRVQSPDPLGRKSLGNEPHDGS